MKRVNRLKGGQKENLSRVKRNAYLKEEQELGIGIGHIRQSDLEKSIDLTEIKNIFAKEREKEEEKPIIDINEFLKVKKDSKEETPVDSKERLRSEQYSILEKEKVDREEETTSDNLLAGLMATDPKLNESIQEIIMDQIRENEEKSKTQELKESQEKEDTTNSRIVELGNGQLVNSFYTKSMELSKDDFVEEKEEVQTKKTSKVLISFLVIIFFIILGITLFILIKEGIIKWK